MIIIVKNSINKPLLIIDDLSIVDLLFLLHCEGIILWVGNCNPINF